MGCAVSVAAVQCARYGNALHRHGTRAAQCARENFIGHSPSELIEVADRHFENREFDAAIAWYRRAMDKAKESGRQPLYVSDLHHKIALALIGLQQLTDAVVELEKAVKCNAQHALGHYCLGTAIHSLPQEHLSEADQRKNRSKAEKHLQLAQDSAAAASGSADAAGKAWAWDDGRCLAAICNNLAVVLGAAGRPIAATEALRQASTHRQNYRLAATNTALLKVCTQSHTPIWWDEGHQNSPACGAGWGVQHAELHRRAAGGQVRGWRPRPCCATAPPELPAGG